MYRDVMKLAKHNRKQIMTNPHIQNLMQKEVSRKEFLGMAALAAGSVLGFGSIIKLLTGKSLTNHKVTNGYSANGYGR
jgi:hypothetical protein